MIKVEKEKILFSIPKSIKKEFQDCCDSLGMSMSAVLVSNVINFIKESKTKPQNK